MSHFSGLFFKKPRPPLPPEKKKKKDSLRSPVASARYARKDIRYTYRSGQMNLIHSPTPDQLILIVQARIRDRRVIRIDGKIGLVLSKLHDRMLETSSRGQSY